MEGILTDEEAARWEDIRKTFRRNLLTGGGGEDDPVTRVVGQLSGFNVGLEKIGEALDTALAERDRGATLADATVEKLEKIISGLRAVPVDVEIKVMPVQEQASAPAKKAAKKKAARKSATKKAAAKQDLSVDVEAKIEQGE